MLLQVWKPPGYNLDSYSSPAMNTKCDRVEMVSAAYVMSGDGPWIFNEVPFDSRKRRHLQVSPECFNLCCISRWVMLILVIMILLKSILLAFASFFVPGTARIKVKVDKFWPPLLIIDTVAMVTYNFNNIHLQTWLISWNVHCIAYLYNISFSCVHVAPFWPLLYLVSLPWVGMALHKKSQLNLHLRNL